MPITAYVLETEGGLLLDGGQEVSVAKLHRKLPPGKYVVFAKADLVRVGGEARASLNGLAVVRLVCGKSQDEATVSLFPHTTTDRETIALNLAAQVEQPTPDPGDPATWVLAPVGSVELLCLPVTDGLIRIENVKLSALQVDDLHTTHLVLSEPEPPADPGILDDS